MSFLGNLFPGSNLSKDEKSPFEKWGFPPQITEIPAGRQTINSLPAGNKLVSAAIGPSIVIGLGATGRAILGQWLEQTTHYESGSFAHVRVLSLSQEIQPPFASCAAQTHSIALDSSSHVGNSLESFLEAANLRRFYDWLRVSLLNMRDAHVLIIGSVADPEIFLLGVLLQILRTHSNISQNSFLNISAFLTQSSSKKTPVLSNGERYAALREIGRFTFSGLHKTIDLPGQTTNIIRSALLDHLFLFDGDAVSSPEDFSLGIGQSLSEIFFFLNHPSSKPFWEALKNDSAAELRQRHRQPFIHTLGVKTFFVPLPEMHARLAARLALAVLFGERQTQDVAEQFVPPSMSSNSATAETLARRWLIDSAAGAHPIFEWLWTIYPSAQTPLPEIHVGYQDLYAFKVSNSLINFLNEPNSEDKLHLAELVFGSHVQRFDKLIASFEAVASSQPLRRDSLLQLLRGWRKTADHLRQSLIEWQKTFLAEEAPSGEPSASTTSMRIDLNWKSAAMQDGNSPVGQTVYGILQRRYKETGEALQKITNGRARFALTYRADAPLEEVEKYYVDSIRPEISRLGLPVSPAFRAVRNRLEWWVRLAPAREPELMVICWRGAATVTPSVRPSPEDCYFYEDRRKLAEAILALAETQTGGYNELTGEWYARRLRETIESARGNTEEVFLRYNENLSAPFRGDARHYYLAAKNKTLSGAFIKNIFPLRLPSDVTELDDYDPTRFTALVSRFSIPFSALSEFNQWYDSYNHTAGYHSQPQEKLAAAYEDRFFRVQGRKILFSPDFVMALADSQLVTLFCQALFCGIVKIRNQDMGAPSFWHIAAIPGFDLLDLESSASPDSLFEAFRKFTLEIPNDSDVILNPSKHFHPSRRATFLKALHKEVRSVRVGENFKTLRVQFQNGILAEWGARNDPLSASFVALLQVELEEPFWEGWYS